MTKPFLAPVLGVIAALAAGSVIVGSETSAQSSDKTAEPVLLELFTSQGCSSCPPADRVAARLDRDSNSVVISRPVTYWDRLGWKDTLAKPANTDLQRSYSRRGLQGRNGVYTPQIVANGQFGTVGSQENAVRIHIGQAQRIQRAALRASRLGNGAVAVGIAGPEKANAQLLLVAVKHKAEVAIGRGENTGRTVTYTNVLKSERLVGEWMGGKQGLKIEASNLKVPGADRYALVLREANAGPNSGRVLAASWIN